MNHNQQTLIGGLTILAVLVIGLTAANVKTGEALWVTLTVAIVGGGMLLAVAAIGLKSLSQ